MAARNRKKKQGCDEELLGCKKEDPWALVRKLEAQLAQEKFFHEKTKTDHQYEVKTLQAKVKNLEKQRKIFLEKLEQNPVEQQNKLEKELNDTSRQLREITQKLVSSQQQVDKLLRSNRAIKKSKEKLSEEFLERIKNKNALIQKLEAQILDLKTSQENHIRIHKDSGPEQTNACLELNDTAEMWDHPAPESLQVEDERQETDYQYNMEKFWDSEVLLKDNQPCKNSPGESPEYWKPSDSVAMEMWDVSDEDNTHAVKEEKGRNEDRCNLNVAKTLEEKHKVEECKVSFFPSMYEASNGTQGCRSSPSPWTGFQKEPTNTPPTNCPTDLDGQHLPRNTTTNETSVIKDDNEVKVQKNNYMKPTLPRKKLTCWEIAQRRVHIAKLCRNRNTGSPSDDINRVRRPYNGFAHGYKTDSPTSSPPQEIRPPPGFNFIDNEAAMRAGIDFFKLESCQPAGKMDSSPNQ